MGKTTDERFRPELMRGSLELMVLSVLAETDHYGYSLQKRLREASGAMVDLKAGTLYPLLHRLEGDGLVRTRWEATTGRGRKWYTLTAKGRKRLGHQAREWFDYVACLRQLLEPFCDPPSVATES
jgi:PadR family transcriptional regulator PadR